MPTEAETTGALDERVRTELLPDLEVLRSLGTGTSANVYLARETSLQRLVAVKVLRPSVAADDILRRRFEREAQSAARIVHSHVTAVYRVGHLSDNVPYIVMEYVEGRTLADMMESGVGVEPGQARAMLCAIASALAAAHERGIVHRDVRPGNVLVDRAGRAVLGDFGIAALLESGASSNA
ncbi:MAG: serine/threonine-protein kinase, partial [Longimicrobiales bacterium]